MRLKKLFSMMAAVGLVAGCAQQPTAAEAVKPVASDNLLLRVQFAGTSALMANTNAAYLTNFAALPETAALGTQIVAKVAGLPGRLAGEEHRTSNIQHPTSNKAGTPKESEVRGQTAEGGTVTNGATSPHPTLSPPPGAERADGAHGVTRPTGGELLQPVFAEMLRDGFTLELRGDKSDVTEFALAAKADGATAKRWDAAWSSAATNWFAPTAPTQESPHPNPLPFRGKNSPKPDSRFEPLSPTTPLPALSSPSEGEERVAHGEGGWSVGAGRLMVKRFGDWFFVAGSKTDATTALAAIAKSVGGAGLEAGAVLQGELASSLLPGPIQRSVYGGFDRLKLSVAPADQSLKIRGTATYDYDLPKLGPPPVIPTNLVTEPAISFTLVREPGAWLEAKSALRRFLPNPVPDVAFFWGGESSPYQLSMAIPFAGRDSFNKKFGPTLLDQLLPLAKFLDTGSVVLDTNRGGIQWQGVPFVAPQVRVRKSGLTNFLVAEVFPPNDFPPGLTPALIERVSDRTNLVLYDWEFTALRLDTAIRIGQLVVFSSGHQQLVSTAPSLKWLQSAQTNMTSGGNTSTEITQTGPRELTLSRRAPLAFNSTELFWLANWLESTNFPAANFLMPVAQ